MSAYLVFVLITRFDVVLTHIIIVEKILNEILFFRRSKNENNTNLKQTTTSWKISPMVSFSDLLFLFDYTNVCYLLYSLLAKTDTLTVERAQCSGNEILCVCTVRVYNNTLSFYTS